MADVNTNLLVVRTTRKITGLPVKANAVIRKNDIVMAQTADGLCKEGQTATSSPAIGIACQDVDNTGGADGAKTIDVWQGDFQVNNSATNTITKANVAAKAAIYIEDEISAGNVSTGRSLCGTLVDVNSNGVVVRIEN